jgi:3-hydroxyacyl-[acyl-carrier-protein] dehydratase
MADPHAFQSALAGLPHGPGFRFVDGLTDLEPGVSAAGNYRVKEDEWFFAGHFPGNPMLPGVIMVEAIAQLGGIVVQSDPARPPVADLRLTAIRAAKVLGAARPGESLTIKANIEGCLGNLFQISGEIHGVNGLLASAKVTLSSVQET